MKRLGLGLLLVIAVASLAGAQGVGIFSRPDCTTLTSPVSGQTVCFDETASAWKVWNGTRYVSDVSSATAVINVKTDYGAKCDNTTDDTTAIQNAVNAVPAGGGYVWIPQGPACKITSAITISTARTYLVGSGKRGSSIRFAPTGNGPAIKFSAGASVLYQTGILGLGLTSTDTTFTKTGVEVDDVSEFVIQEFAIGPQGSWTGASSVGLQFKGRELINIDRVDIAADIPLKISADPNNSVALDHTHLSNCYLLASGTNPVVSLDTGLVIQNLTFDGYQAWVTGGHGLQWLDTTSSLTSLNWRFENIRWEQSTNATGYIFDLEANTSIQNVIFRNIYGGLNTRGMKLRNVWNTTIENYYYVGSGVAFDVNATVRPLSLNNVFFQAGSSTSIVGLTNILDTGQSALGGQTSPRVIYDVYSGGSQILTLGNGVNVTGKGIQVNSPTGGDKGAGTVNISAGYYIAGGKLADAGATYTQLYTPSSVAALTMGNAGDPSSYYDNTSHVFRGAAAGTTRATIGTGMQVGAPTGGDKGAGTVNAAASYWTNGKQLTTASGSIVNASVTFGSGLLNTLTADGMMIYCSDCTAASVFDQTCAGGGTGNLAVRINGVAKCAF